MQRAINNSNNVHFLNLATVCVALKHLHFPCRHKLTDITLDKLFIENQ